MRNPPLCIKKLHGASTEVGGCWFAAGARVLIVDTDPSPTLPLTRPPSLSEVQPQDRLGVSLKGQHLSCHRAWASLPAASAHTPPPAFLLPSHTSHPTFLPLHVCTPRPGPSAPPLLFCPSPPLHTPPRPFCPSPPLYTPPLALLPLPSSAHPTPAPLSSSAPQSLRGS